MRILLAVLLLLSQVTAASVQPCIASPAQAPSRDKTLYESDSKLHVPDELAGLDQSDASAPDTSALQDEDTAEATRAAIAWHKEKDPKKKVPTGTELIRRYPGTKVADFVAGMVFNDEAFSGTQKAEIARVYYEVHTARRLDATYLEYSLLVWAAYEKDPVKRRELTKLYLKKYLLRRL